MGEADVDGDNRVVFSEYVTMMMGYTMQDAHTTDDIFRIFQDCSHDKDNLLTPHEMCHFANLLGNSEQNLSSHDYTFSEAVRLIVDPHHSIHKVVHCQLFRFISLF